MSHFDPHQRMPGWLEDVWLARYLARGLDADEQGWFEAYVIDKPALLEILERDSDLRDGFAAAAAAAPVAPSSRGIDQDERAGTDATVTDLSSRRALPGRLPRPVAVAAAMLLSGTLGLFAGQWAQRSGDAFAPIGSPTRIVFDTQRGAGSASLVDAGNADSPWVLVEVALPPDATDLVFIDADGHRTPLQPGNDGFASVLLPRARVRPGGEASIAYQWRGAPASRDISFPAAERSPSP